jgi:hypothetical protein
MLMLHPSRRPRCARTRTALLVVTARGLAPLGLAQLLVHPDRHELHDTVGDADAPLHLLHQASRPLHDQEHVGAFAVLAHQVGEALLAPLLDLLDAAPFLLGVALDLRGQGVHLGLAEVGVRDEQDLVDAFFHGLLILLVDR